MVLIPIILSFCFISKISAYELEAINVTNNMRVLQVQFDAEGNTYVLTQAAGHTRLCKLSSSSNKLLSPCVSLPSKVTKMLVSSHGDVYLQYSRGDSDFLLMVRSNLTEIKEVEEVSYVLFHLDSNDNFFYCDKTCKTVYVIRSNTAHPVVIRNLEGILYAVGKLTVSDKLGNTYFPVGLNGKTSLALIAILPREMEFHARN